MAKKRKNQPGYVQSRGKDGRIVWVPKSRASSSQHSDETDVKSDFLTEKRSHEEVYEDLLDTFDDYNDHYDKKYAHLYGSNFGKRFFEWKTDDLAEQQEKGMIFDEDWDHDAEIVTEMMHSLIKDELTEDDRQRVRDLHEQLIPFKEIRKPGVWSSNDKFTKGNERTVLHSTARQLLEEANTYQVSNAVLAEKLEEDVNRSDRMINAGGSFEELYDTENEMFRNSGHEYYYGIGTKPYLNAAINELMDKNKKSVDEEYSDKTSDFVDPYNKALHTISESPNLYLASVFPEKYLAAKLEQYDIDGVFVSPFVNGREYGNVYTVLDPEGNPMSFSVYEHRNSDSIIINGKKYWDGEELPYAADSKNAFFAEFAPYDFDQAADALAMYIKDTQEGNLPSENYLVETAHHRDWGAILSEQFGKPFDEFLGKHFPQEAKRLKKQKDDEILNDLDFDPEIGD